MKKNKKQPKQRSNQLQDDKHRSTHKKQKNAAYISQDNSTKKTETTKQFNLGDIHWGVWLSVVLGLTFIVYFPVFNHDFVNWDDDWYIIENPYLRDFSISKIILIFSEFYKGQYSPVTTVFLAAIYSAVELNPFLYHTFSIGVHLINTLLVFWLAHQVVIIKKTKSFLPNRQTIVVPLVVAALFGVHTLQVESVAWISAIKVALYTLFFLCSLIFYLKYIKTFKIKHLVFALLFFLLSFGSKEQALVLPVVLIVFDYYADRKLLSKKVIFEKIPFLVLAIIFGIVSLLSQAKYGAISENQWYPFYQRIAYASYAVVEYLMQLVFPHKIAAFYPFPVHVGEAVPGLYWIYPIVVAGLIALVVYSLKRTKVIAFSALFFGVNIFLALQLVSTGREVIVADRYMYLPSIGVFFLLGFALQQIITSAKTVKWKKTLFSVAVIAYILSLTFVSHQRSKVWSDGITMWTDVQNKYPTVHVAFYNRGNKFLEFGKDAKTAEEADKNFNQAIADYDNAEPLKPSHVGTYSNRGITYANMGKLKLALKNFDKVVTLDSAYENVYSNRGNTKAMLGDFQGAVDDYSEALRLKPDYIDAFYNRSIARDSLKDYKGSISDLDMVLNAKPDFAEAYAYRGFAKHKAGDIEGAKIDFDKANTLSPKMWNEYYTTGLQQANALRYFDAYQYYSKALLLKPEDGKPYFNRAIARDNLGDLKGAFNDYTKSIELKINEESAYTSRGVIWGRSGNFKKAIADLDKAIELNPVNSGAYSNRGLAKDKLGDFKGAIKDYTKAIELNPKFAMAYNNRAIVRKKINDIIGALDDYNIVIELNSNFAEAYYQRGKIQLGYKQKKLACEDFNKALNLGLKIASIEIQNNCN